MRVNRNFLLIEISLYQLYMCKRILRSCWAFTAVAALEGQYFRKYGRSIVLSDQNLVDCSMAFGNQGCQGGLDVYAFNYVIANNGISTSNSYPVKYFYIHIQI
jgi:hypothetical protein